MRCLPIQASTVAAVQKAIKKASKYAEIIEIWLDYLETGNLSALKTLVRGSPKPLLAVAKPFEEQGKFSGSESARIDFLITAAQAGFRYIDVGIATPKHLIQKLIKNRQKAQIIISYHNFKATPPLASLQKICLSAHRQGANLVKIATHINHFEDNLIIFQLLNWVHLKLKTPIIALGMGKKGKISRVFGPKLGSFLSYFPLSHLNSTAPGQLTIKEYEIVNKILFPE